MTTLINISTKQVVTRADLQAMFPNVSFAADFSLVSTAEWATFGVAPLTYTPAPSSEFGSVTMGEPAENADGTYSTTWTTETLPIDQCQQIQLNKLAMYRAGVVYKDVVYNNVAIPVDTQVIAILQVVAAGSATIDFKGNNGWLKVTPTDATAIITAIQTQVQNGFSNEKAHHDAIMALTDVNEVISYDFTTGW
jgi:hypothetical protein